MGFDYDLRLLATKEHLLTYLGIECEWFDKILDFDPTAYENSYDTGDITHYLAHPFHRHDIPKRNHSRGVRQVWEATAPFDSQYKSLARRLHNFFSLAVKGYPHNGAYGYVRGRNTKQNATCCILQYNYAAVLIMFARSLLFAMSAQT